MKGIALTGVIVLGLSACAGTQGIGADQLARAAAKEVVNGVVQTRFPGVNAAPITDCIIDQASAPELFEITQSAALGSNDQATQLVLGIAQRPETIRCAAQDFLGPLSGLAL